jgi:hypothetical protein
MTDQPGPAPLTEAAVAAASHRIPLADLCDWLAAHGLRVVGGDPDARHPGRVWRPVLYLVPVRVDDETDSTEEPDAENED